MEHLLRATANAEARHFWFRGFRAFVTPLLRQAAAGLNEVIRATRDSLVRIALENTAGQGTTLGATFELHSPRGKRSVPAEEFYTGLFTTAKRGGHTTLAGKHGLKPRAIEY